MKMKIINLLWRIPRMVAKETLKTIRMREMEVSKALKDSLKRRLIAMNDSQAKNT